MLARRAVHLLAVAAACAALAGCVESSALLRGPVPQVVRGKLPDALRVTRRDSTQVTLYAPALNGDTLLGWNEPPSSRKPGQRFLHRVAVADILQLSELGTDVGGSIGVAGLLFLGLIVYTFASYHGPSF